MSIPRRSPISFRPFLRARVLGLAAAVAVAAGCTSDGKLDTGQEKVADETAMRAHYEEAAQTYYDGGDYMASERQWRKVLAITPEDPKANWGLAMALAKQGDPGALRASEQIFVKIVDWDWTHPTLGNRKHEVQKDFAEVYLELAEWYDRDVHALEERRRESNDPLLGGKIQTQVAARNSLLGKAMPLYDQVLAHSPDNPYALAGLAKAHLLIGDQRRGLDYARRYIAISRESQVNWQRKLDEAVRDNQGVVTDDLRDLLKGRIRGAKEKELRMHLLVATVLMRSEDYRGAVAEYDRVLEIDPARPAAYVERAQAYAGTKEYRKAIADVQEYLKITDPIRHRGGRIGAADLLQRYRALDDASRGIFVPAPGTVPVRPSDAPVVAGSPDG